LAEDLNLIVIRSSNLLPGSDIEALSPDIILLDHWAHDGKDTVHLNAKNINIHT
jgi:hypothetical protein